MIALTAMIVVGLWLVFGVRSGIWTNGFLWNIPLLTYQFALFYAVATLFGVLTRSAVLSILMACLAWLLLWLAGLGYGFAEATREQKLVAD